MSCGIGDDMAHCLCVCFLHFGHFLVACFASPEESVESVESVESDEIHASSKTRSYAAASQVRLCSNSILYVDWCDVLTRPEAL